MRRVRIRLLTVAAVALVVLGIPAGAQGQALGRVSGQVLDEHNGMGLPGVTVEVPGTSHATQTDLDGRFRMELPAGTHEIAVALEGYEAKRVRLAVVERQPITVDITLGIARYSEVVTVTADAIAAATSTSEAQLLERKRAPVITDNLGGQEMQANADSNAASALQRVTGLSVVDNQFVYVRGLGERYSNTTLGGAAVPSTEPERKVVSLDMFPAGLLDSVSIVKSYSPDRSADFAGGLVEIVPAKLPARPLLDFSYSVGVNSQTFGADILDHPGSRGEWFGFGGAARQLPAGFPERRVIRGGIFTPELGVGRAELERLGEAFENRWSPDAAEGRPNQGFSASFGRRWGRVGLLASLTQSYRNHYQEEEQNYYRTEADSGLTPFSEYNYRAASHKGTLAGLAGAFAQITPQHRIGVQGFSTNRGDRETRTFEGYNSDAGRELRNTRLMWREESLRSGQLSGDHFFQRWSNTSVDWRLSSARSRRDEPDLRETLYEKTGSAFLLADESQSGYRMFTDLDETVLDAGANWSIFFRNWNGLPTMVKMGPSYARRERDFSSRRFRFIPLDTRGLDLAQAPEQLLSAANIGPRFELREETRATDFYAAEQSNVAGFGMVDLPLADRWRLVGGVRVERFRQRVDTFDLFDADVDGDPDVIRAEIRNTDVFPAANLVFAVGGDQNLRFGASQTVNRPEFRELAPFEFTDIVGGRAVVGNPELTRALIRNYDVRWEWFPGAEQLVAASVFYKSFSNPIERFVEPTAQLRTSFTNADSARNVGFELEARRRVIAGLLVGANYTFVDSEITLTDFQTNVLTSLSRPLYGTSRHVFNGMAEARRGGTSARLLVNYFGDRIADVGSLGLPDIVEEGRTALDLAVSQRLGRVTLRFAAENLADAPVRFIQGDQVQRRYSVGRLFMLQLGFAAF